MSTISGAWFAMTIIIVKVWIANITNWGTQTSHTCSLAEICLIVAWIRFLEKNCTWNFLWQWLACSIKENEAWVTFWTCGSRRAFITIIHTCSTLITIWIKHMRTFCACRACALFTVVWASFTASIKIGHNWTGTFFSIENFAICTDWQITFGLTIGGIPHHTWFTFCSIGITICAIANLALFT